MKKIVSFALMLAVLLTCVIVPVSADTAENPSYFEPSYDESSWKITTADGTTVPTEKLVTFDKASKTINFAGDIRRATYTDKVMTGDFILFANVANTNEGLANIIDINVCGETFSFLGGGFVKHGDNSFNEEDYRIDKKIFDVKIEYKSDEGILELYVSDGETYKSLIKLDGDAYKNKNDGSLYVQGSWIYGSGYVNNIRMYKKLPSSMTGDYGDHFVPSYDSADWNITTASGAPLGASDEKNVSFDAGNKEVIFAKDKEDRRATYVPKVMTGDFVLCVDIEHTGNTNSNYINIAGVTFEFNGSGWQDSSVTVDGVAADKKGWFWADNADANGSTHMVIISYTSADGTIKVYEPISAEDKTIGKYTEIYSVTDAKYANKNNGKLYLESPWVNGTKFRNLEMFKPGYFAIANPKITLDGESGKLTGTAKITNTSATAKNAVVILAVYAPDGSLADVKTSSVDAGICRDLTVTAESDKYTSGCTAKCFVFDSLDTVTPLATAANYPEGN